MKDYLEMAERLDEFQRYVSIRHWPLVREAAALLRAKGEECERLRDESAKLLAALRAIHGATTQSSIERMANHAIQEAEKASQS